MLIELDFNYLDAPRGKVRLALDWQQKTWKVDDDSQRLWLRICSSAQGSFSASDQGGITISDMPNLVVTLLGAPWGETDSHHNVGKARLIRNSGRYYEYDVSDWRAVSGSAQQSVAPAGQGSLREFIIAELNKRLPCSYGKNTNYMWLTGGQLEVTTRTNCYIMGLAVTKLAGLYKGMKDNSPALSAFITRKSLSGMEGMLRDGRGKSAWKDAKHPLNTMEQRPRPGDLFGVLHPDKPNTPENRARTAFTHVGVIQDCSADVWKTMDFGQGANPGYNGVKDNPRTYDPAKGTLTGNGTRVLAGWVDIEQYFGS